MLQKEPAVVSPAVVKPEVNPDPSLEVADVKSEDGAGGSVLVVQPDAD